MPAVELTDGEQVEGRTNNPSQPANARGLSRSIWPYCSSAPSMSLDSSANSTDDPTDVPRIIPRVGSTPAARTSEFSSPISSAGMATTSPASGPATATSNRARRCSVGDFIWMKAPNVPRANGTGMKNGGVTWMPCRLAVK